MARGARTIEHESTEAESAAQPEVKAARGPFLCVRDLTYRPLAAESDVLRGVSLDIGQREFVLLLGPSGSGKTTLSKCFNGLIPHLDQGEMQGSVQVDGKDTRTHPIHEFSSLVGIVFQNPDDQILSLRVAGEVAFGLELQGLDHEEIVRRTEQYLALLEISDLRDRLTFAISGGQKQRVSIASNLALSQQLLILDDPTTDLDPVGKREIVHTLSRLSRDLGRAVVVIEHDLDELVEIADRILIINEGRIAHDGPPAEVLSRHRDELIALGVNVPQHIELLYLLMNQGMAVEPFPVMREKVFDHFRAFVREQGARLHAPERPSVSAGEPVVSVKRLSFAYQPAAPVLQEIDFDVARGEFMAIIGANGSGKSTLINTLVGLLKPDSGEIRIHGQDVASTKVSELVADIGYVFQNPDHQLFANTVEQELRFSLRLRGLSPREMEERIAETLRTVGLDALRARHPLSLSRGQRQNLAVATALVHHPGLILLDEPTTGQDRRNLSGLLDLLSGLNRRGNTTIMITHDMDIVAAYATRVLIMSNGRIVYDGAPESVFYDQFETLQALSLRPPTIVDFCRRLEDLGCPRFLTVEELGQCLEGGETPHAPS